MPIFGDLRTLPLPELLRVAASTQKTGVLEVERNGISRRIEFRKGHVGSCSSNDPRSRLGQFLLFRDRVNEIQLQHLLTLQESTGKRLGLLLVELGILTRQELASEVATNARETIYGLFDWDDAYFRFDDGATLDPDQIEVTLSVDELIAEGQERTRRLGVIRETFKSSGVVLQRTGHEIPSDLHASPAAHRAVDAIDGRRTLAEILLHARAPEFVTLEFLHRLHERDAVRIQEICPASEGSPTLLDTPAARDELTPTHEIDRGFGGTETDETPSASGRGDLVEEIEEANRLMDCHEYEAAMELLRSSCREHPTDYVRHLLMKAEGALVASVWKDNSFGAKVPVLARGRQDLLSAELPPDESFLLSLIDGMTDLQAIVWLTPLREVDVIVAVRRMIDKGMIELAEAVNPEPLAENTPRLVRRDW